MFGLIIEYDICCVLPHAPMSSVVDYKECFEFLLLSSEPYSILIHLFTQFIVVNILYNIDVVGFKAKSLKSVLEIDHVLSDLINVMPCFFGSHLGKFGIP